MSLITVRKDLGQILIGSLVLYKIKRVVQVHSLYLADMEINPPMGTGYYGKINGESAEHFDDCPITVALLQNLGWTIEKARIAGLTTAWPKKGQFSDTDAWQQFPVHFVEKDDAIGDWEEGSILIKRPGTDILINVDSMHKLEYYFLGQYSIRMEIDIPDEGLPFAALNYAKL